MGASSRLSGLAVRIQGILVERVDAMAGTCLMGHGHAEPHQLFLLHGGLEERDRGRWQRMDSGGVRLSPPGDQHDLRFLAPSRCLLVLLSGETAGTSPPIPPERVFRRDPRLQPLADAIQRNVESWEHASPFRLEALVLELLAAAIPGQSTGRNPPRWLDRIREQIRDCPNHPPSTAQLAAGAGYHPVYVARLFRAHYGIGVGEFARLARAEYARDLLATTPASIAQVAVRAGYADQSHLTRSLTRVLGRTPAEVRRSRKPLVEVASVQDPAVPAT